MTTRRPRPQAPPLADTLRAALAQGWHTLDALEALAGRATGARLRVHAALAELRAEGCALEERVERGVAEVRELPPVADGATCPACKAVVREHDDHHGWCAVGIRDCGWWAARGEPSAPVEVASAAPSEPATALDALAPPCEPSAPAEVADGPGEAPRAPTLAALSVLRCDRVSPPGEWERLRCERYGCDGAHEARDGEAVRRWTDAPAPTEAERRAAGEEAEAAACARIAALPKGRGPGSRCANCDATRAKHEAGKGCGAWAEKPRGRPRVAALDAPPVESAAAESGGAEPETSRGEHDPADAMIAREIAILAASPRLANPTPCRPPACHADDIHEPSRVRGFARPLCERHRRWVEGAGGTVARADALDVIH